MTIEPIEPVEMTEEEEIEYIARRRSSNGGNFSISPKRIFDGSKTSKRKSSHSVLSSTLELHNNKPGPGTVDSIKNCISGMSRGQEILLSNLSLEPQDREQLVETLLYTTTVLRELLHEKKQQLKELMDEGASLSDSISRSGSVNDHVKEWLLSTFTRAPSRTSIPPQQENRRFRSVATVIRVGIMVDRFRRALYRIPIQADVATCLENLESWDFNVFELNEVSNNNALKFVCYEVFNRFDILTKFKIRGSILDNMLGRMQEGYSLHGNPYHNLIHGADVTQGVFYFLSSSKMAAWLTDVELFAVTFAAAIHDLEHTGTTNAFHVNSGSDLALLYNDRSVLESHHVSSIFRIMSNPDMNILASLTRDEFKEMRMLMIEIVLNTDMQFHFTQIKNMKNLLAIPESIDKQKALSLIVHCADISHAGRTWDRHKQWTLMLVDEFFRQGDREAAAGLPISPLCDRHNSTIANGQIGFIDFIVAPTYEVTGEMVERILEPLVRKLRGQPETIQEEESDEEDDESAENGNQYKVNNFWTPNLTHNKDMWRELAVKEAVDPDMLKPPPPPAPEPSSDKKV